MEYENVMHTSHFNVLRAFILDFANIFELAAAVNIKQTYP
jgi:hypothetical protein